MKFILNKTKIRKCCYKFERISYQSFCHLFALQINSRVEKVFGDMMNDNESRIESHDIIKININQPEKEYFCICYIFCVTSVADPATG